MHHPTRQHRHLAHASSLRDNPIVFVTTGTNQRKKLLANAQCHEILREIWEKSAVIDGWWVGHYILMPDHVHLFARPAIDARPMAISIVISGLARIILRSGIMWSRMPFARDS
jgi:REP element-mobilizing transposase RayT